MSRCFIVGNGPSLADTPMDSLVGETTIAMNNIHRIVAYHGWKWRPTYYLRIDHNPVEIDMSFEAIDWAKDNCKKLFLWEQFRNGYKTDHGNYHEMPYGCGSLQGTNVQWIKKCKHHPYSFQNIKAVQSWHLPTLCTAFGGMNPVLQIAAMEFDEIYLVGCDIGYSQKNTDNYACPDYTKETRVQNNDNMVHIHKLAKRCSPVKIYNATIGGSLDVYPRVDLQDVLNE